MRRLQIAVPYLTIVLCMIEQSLLAIALYSYASVFTGNLNVVTTIFLGIF